MPTKPILVQIDDVERPATAEEKAQIDLLREDAAGVVSAT